MHKEVQLLKEKRNLILTGAPGTGKTYKTAEIALAILGKDILNKSREDLMAEYREAIKDGYIAFTTFHQSMDYEEFVEGLKPDIDEKTNQGTGTYSVKNGIFKKICEQAFSLRMEVFNIAWQKLIENLSKFKTIKWKANSDTNEYEFKLSSKGNNIEFIHVESRHSVNKEEIEETYRGVKQQYHLGYKKCVVDYLIEKCDLKEYNHEEYNHVLIIDEINRGNVSKIFGELITLLEKDKRYGETNVIEVTLPYSQKNFSVPNNLYIIGTMNSADRSIGHIDYAIRRRFAFYSIKSDVNVIEEKCNDKVKEKAKSLFKNIEKLIQENINSDLDAEDLMIGHSYFLCENIDELKAKLEYEIIPLVKEYNNDGIITVEREKLKEEFNKWRNNI